MRRLRTGCSAQALPPGLRTPPAPYGESGQTSSSRSAALLLTYPQGTNSAASAPVRPDSLALRRAPLLRPFICRSRALLPQVAGAYPVWRCSPAGPGAGGLAQDLLYREDRHDSRGIRGLSGDRRHGGTTESTTLPAGTANPALAVCGPPTVMAIPIRTAGTARAQDHLRQMCVFLNMFPINQPGVMIGNAAGQFDAEGKLTDEMTQDFIRQLLQNLVAWIRRIGPPQET